MSTESMPPVSPAPPSAPAPTFVVNSIEDYVRLIGEFLHGSQEALWFRGLGNASFALVPSLYRHPTLSDFASLIALERLLLDQFRSRSPAYAQRIPEDPVELLFLMQHYGAPTRLLDWSENAFAALFFALSSDRTGQQLTDATVWVLNPKNWNAVALKTIGHGDRGVLSVREDLPQGYKPKKGTLDWFVPPVAIYSVYNSTRIVAQRGVFVLFGQGVQPMESLAMEAEKPGTLVRITIPSNQREGMLSALRGMGITDATLFPDLEGLARDLKRLCGFLVI